MKATLEFNMPEDQINFKHATKGFDYYLALNDIDNYIRNYLKYDENKTIDSSVTLLESIRSIISDATYGVE